MQKYGKARLARDDNIIRRMRIASWITKNTGTHSENATLIASPQQWHLKVTFISTLPVLFQIIFQIVGIHVAQLCL